VKAVKKRDSLLQIYRVVNNAPQVIAVMLTQFIAVPVMGQTTGGWDGPLPSPPDLDVIHTDSPPVIDGNLDDPVWDKVKPLVFAKHPAKNDSTIARVKLAWDNSNLYVAFDISDTQVEGSADTPWDGDSVSVMVKQGEQVREYRHSLLNDKRGNAMSAYVLKEGTTFNDNKNVDEGFVVEMQIPRSDTGRKVAVDFLSVDHDQNPGGLYDDPKTVFSKVSWDGDASVDTARK